MCHKYHGKQTSNQCNLDCLKSGSKRDTNKTPTCQCGASARPTDEWFDWCCFYYFLRNSLVDLLEALFARSLGRWREGYNQGSFVYFAKGWGGWMFAGVNGVAWVDVEGHTVLGKHWGEAQRYAPDRDGGQEVWLHARVLCGFEAGREELLIEGRFCPWIDLVSIT